MDCINGEYMIQRSNNKRFQKIKIFQDSWYSVKPWLVFGPRKSSVLSIAAVSASEEFCSEG